MLEMDKQLAITEYLGDPNLPSINCILKRLYSDFIVIEMPKENVALHPDDIDEEDPEEEEPKEVEPSFKRPKIFTEKDLDDIDSVAKGLTSNILINTKDFTKDDRKEAHSFIRNKYKNSLISNGRDGQIEVTRFDDPKRNKRDNRHLKEAWTPHRGDYLHFTLTKENKEAFYILNEIAKICGLNTKIFSTAGSKDRRAITSQRICAFRVPIKKIKKRVKNRLSFCWLSNFKYSNERIHLGSLWGNRFSIILRDIDNLIETEDIANRVKILETDGFLNYFGHQRFGSLDGNTAEIGKLILSSKWEEAVLMILKPKEDTESKLKKILENFLEDSDPVRALKELSGTSTIESTILFSLKKNPKGFRSAILALPRDRRSLYVHAYQSLVFNQILTRRFKKFGLEVLKGDVNIKGEKIESTEGLSLTDVYLPLPSYENNYPDNEVGKWYHEIETKNGITKNSFLGLEKDFSVGNVQRVIVVKPLRVKWTFISQPEPRIPLQANPFVPENKHNNKHYFKNESTPDKFALEDIETQNEKIKSDAISVTDSAKKLDKNQVIKDDVKQQEKKALKIEFDLPSSAYATIALKQLMRVDLSKSVQKKMELS